ncbi:helix-turn-helix domain-containing protein [Staphylococcus schleiferi]|uniref:helix-turn-helix domain-containing protein n=1 Tax=Staphylococcus schleiferi TaxID=1295 RepID=UPI0024802990|nr:helix-turn-helix domain-containing protein [Staphylococcus schleiferi]
MAKYDLEFKMKVVNDYINGLGGYNAIGKRHGINRSIVRKWYHAYIAFGIEGLERKKGRTSIYEEEKD